MKKSTGLNPIHNKKDHIKKGTLFESLFLIIGSAICIGGVIYYELQKRGLV